MNGCQKDHQPWPRHLMRLLGAEAQEWPEPSDVAVNCSRCRMIPIFHPNVKCCSYQPFVANFALGRALKDGFDLPRLPSTQGLSPLGLLAGPAVSVDRFGKHLEDRCPFYRDDLNGSGGCSIFSDRPAVCATYLCFSSQGDRHLTLLQAKSERLSAWEWSVAHEILWRTGYTRDDLHPRWSSTDLIKIYLRTHDVFETLTAPELLALRPESDIATDEPDLRREDHDRPK